MPNSYESAKMSLPGQTSADGSETDSEEVEQNKNDVSKAHEDSQSKSSGGEIRTLRENIARALPESRLRQNMMLKAERKKERLAGERRYAEENERKLRKGLELEKPNNSITAKDVIPFTQLAQGGKNSFYKPLG